MTARSRDDGVPGEAPTPAGSTPAHDAAALTAGLRRLDSLPFPARMRALAEHGRGLDDSVYRAVHAALDAGDADDRHTALFLATVRRDLHAVAAALHDPLLRRRAMSAAIGLPLADEAMSSVVLSPVPGVRHDAYRVLRLSRRRRLADRLLPRVQDAYGPAEAARLLPACSPSAVAEWCARNFAQLPVTLLGTLARTAPAAVAGSLARAHANAAAAGSGVLPPRCPRVVTVLARRDPTAALLLAERAPDLLTAEAVTCLLRTPAALLTAAERGGARLLPLPAGGLPRRVRRALRGLSEAQAVALAELCAPNGPARARHGGITPDPLLLLVPPGQRRAVLRARRERARRRSVSSSEAPALAALEPADRADLLRPLAGLHSRRVRTRWCALLPLPQAEPVLRERTGSHRVFDRVEAWPALIACAALHGDPDAYARVLASAERAWHDQEAVRSAALAAAADTPRPLLRAVPTAVLRDATTTAVQSRDSTPRTLAAAERWLRRTIAAATARGDTERVATTALLLAEVVADPRRQGGRRPLPADTDAARASWAAADGGTRRSPLRLVALAELLGPRLRHLPGADAQLRHCAVEHADLGLAVRAAAVWLLAAGSAQRDERCAELLAARPALITCPEVLRTVATRRTDLLGAVDGPGVPASWVPRFAASATGRWTAAERAPVERRLAALAADGDVPLRERTDAAAALRDPDVLLRLVDHAPQPVAAAALGALGEDATRIGTQEAARLLMPHVSRGGVRGRAAMAALRRRLDAMPQTEALDLLAPLAAGTGSPVATRKQAVRALAMMPGPLPWQALLAAWDAPGRHPDVLAALTRPLAVRMDQPGVAERLAAALRHPAVLEAAAAARRDVPQAARERYALMWAEQVATAPADTAIASCRALATLRGAPAEASALVAAAAADPRRPRPLREPAAALVLAAGGTALRGLLTALADQAAPRAAGGDEPAFAALLVLQHLAESTARVPVPALDVLADTLDRSGLRGLAARVSFDAAVSALLAGDSDPGRWQRCIARAGDRGSRLALDGRQWLPFSGDLPGPALAEVVAALTADPAPVAGAVALALTRAAGARTRWSAPWPAAVRSLTAHPDPEVAESALLAEAALPAAAPR